jgi:hypothetical protein
MRRIRFFMTLIIGFQLVPSLVLAEGHPISPAPVRAVSPGPRPTEQPLPIRTPQGTPDTPSHPQVTPNPEQFCTNLTSVTSMIGGNTNNQFQDLKTNFAGGASKVKQDLTGVGNSLASARAAADQKRDADFQELSAKATTDAQKAAIATFEASVTQAITTERTSVDTADMAFEQGVLAVISARQTALANAAANYKAAVASALSQAGSSCTAGVSPMTVRTTLQEALQAARSALQSVASKSQGLGPNVSNLAATRKAAVQKAQALAKTAIDAALATLKAALGVPAGSPTPSATP